MNGQPLHRVAVVDDEPSMRRALERLLRLSGFEVEAFERGEDLLESLSTRRPDCLVLDLHLPGMTGFDVQERLRELGLEIPVVAITGHDAPATRQRALDGGARAYFRKPVSEDVLIPAIEACLTPLPQASPETEPSAAHRKEIL